MTTFTTTISPLRLAEALSEMEVYTTGDEIVTAAAADYIRSTLDGKPAVDSTMGLTIDINRLKRAIFGSGDYPKDMSINSFEEMARITEQARKGALLRAQSAEEEMKVLASDLDALKTAIHGSDEWRDKMCDIPHFLKMISNVDEMIKGYSLRAEKDGEKIQRLTSRIKSALALLEPDDDGIVDFNDIAKAIKYLKGEL